MPDKPAKNDSRRMWERLLSSIPHEVKVRTVSVTDNGGKKAAAASDRTRPPPEPATPGPSGPE